MSAPIGHKTEADILERMIEPQVENLDPALARFLLSLRFKREDQERVEELSAKAQEASLTDDEGHELDSYLNLGHFLALLQSKARVSLRHVEGV